MGKQRKRIDLSKHTQSLCELMVVLISLIVVLFINIYIYTQNKTQTERQVGTAVRVPRNISGDDSDPPAKSFLRS